LKSQALLPPSLAAQGGVVTLAVLPGPDQPGGAAEARRFDFAGRLIRTNDSVKKVRSRCPFATSVNVLHCEQRLHIARQIEDMSRFYRYISGFRFATAAVPAAV